jgi:twitching motility two-component system response regulator PilH
MSKILIVDDSAPDLENLKSILTKAHYQVITADSGDKAIEMAHREKPNVILLDIVMQGTDGYRACREISRADDTKDIPILFVSSKHQKADEMWARKQGGKALISKPYTEDQIINEVSSYC